LHHVQNKVQNGVHHGVGAAESAALKVEALLTTLLLAH
jgi:hypothetical protein